MILCMCLGNRVKFGVSLLLLLLLNACSQNPAAGTTQHQQIVVPPNTGLTLNKAYSLAKTSAETQVKRTEPSLYESHQVQLQMQNPSFYAAQNTALSLVETYWELAIVQYALQRIWLVQKLLISPASFQDITNNLATPIPRNQLKALAATERKLSLYQNEMSRKLSQLTNIKQTNFSLNYLPLSEVRVRLPKPKSLLAKQFSNHLLKQSYATYVRLASRFPNLKILTYKQLYEEPILGKYVWSEISTSLYTETQLLAPAKVHKNLSHEIQLAQLNWALANYHYNYQKMQSLKLQYQAAENHFILTETEQINGLLNPQSVYSLSIETMAIHLIYLQATLDTLHAYTKLLASSNLPPKAWQQSFETLSLTPSNNETLTNIIGLTLSGDEQTGLQNNDHLVSISAYGDDLKGAANNIGSLALEEHFKTTEQNTIISGAVEPYLWQVEVGTHTDKIRTQLFNTVPEFRYQLYSKKVLDQTSGEESLNTLKIKGLSHNQARALCVRLKSLNQECWLLQSEL